jgi:hypothetical protein
MRPALTLPIEFAVRVLTGYVPLDTARDLALNGGSAHVFETGQVILVEAKAGQVTIK